MTQLLIMLPLIVVAIAILINILIIRGVCKYIAKQSTKELNYDYLANRTAEEICKRMMIIEKQKSAACNAAQELNDSPQE